MNRRALLSLAAASAVAAGCARARRPPPIHWVSTLVEADAIVVRHPVLSKRPVLILVGASWDASSKELEAITFDDPSVRSLVNDQYLAVYLDMSDSDDAETQRAQRRFGILGTPMVLVFTPRFERERLRIAQFVQPSELLSQLASHP